MGFFAFLGFIVWVVLMVLIFKKAGYSGLQIILIAIPFINVIVFVWFALTEWPIEKDLRNLKSKMTMPSSGSETPA
jgi:hypothetical protein